MSTLTIEKVTKDNYDDFAYCIEYRRLGRKPLEEETYQMTLEEDEIGLFDLVAKGLMHVYMARQAGEPAGYISASVIPKPDKRLGTMFVDELWVAEGFRGLGIAKSLMTQVIEASESMGLWRTRLYVSAENHSGIKCYEGVGMARSGETCYFYEK